MKLEHIFEGDVIKAKHRFDKRREAAQIEKESREEEVIFQMLVDHYRERKIYGYTDTEEDIKEYVKNLAVVTNNPELNTIVPHILAALDE